MKKKLQIGALILVIPMFLTACIGSHNVKNKVVPYPATVLNVTIAKQPKTVATLSPSITDILVDLGYQKKIVGYSTDSKLPEGVENPQLIGTGLKPDLLKIGEIAPEIIFTNTPLTKVQLEKVSGVGIKVVVMPAVKSVEDLKLRYQQIIAAMEGQVVANAKGKDISTEIQSHLNFIASKMPQSKPTFLYVASLDPLIATGDTFESSLLSYMGTNLAGEYVQYQVTAEQAKAMNPDIILFIAPIEAEHIKQSELFNKSNAVVNDKLFAVDAIKLALQNKDIADNLREIVTKIYPDIDFIEPVPAVSSEAQKKKWYEFFK